MHILAVDTTTRAGSLAVARDAALLHERSGDPLLTHGQRLPGDIMRAIGAAGIRVEDLDLLAVASGPGSFTGLRVGIAALQGLAVARRLQVVPVPTLELLAVSANAAPGTDEVVAAWMDGQRGEVFAALYDEAGREIDPPVAATPDAVLGSLALAARAPSVFVGDGAVRYRALIEERLGAGTRVLEPPPLAPALARIAFAQPHRAVGPHQIAPVYVRRPDAELARDRRLGPPSDKGRP